MSRARSRQVEPTEQFAELASDEEGWFFTALNLLYAAELLEPKIEEYWRIEHEHRTKGTVVFEYQPDPRAIYFMLVAYAVENLCKGLLVERSPGKVWASAVKSGTLPPEVLGHNLEELLKRIGFPLGPDERELAFRLERSSVWSARYPVPTKAKHKTVHFKTATGEEIVPTWHKEDDVAIVKSFLGNLFPFIDKQLRYSNVS